MSPPGAVPTGLVADANVLIDYADADRSILTLICCHLSPIHVPTPVLEEVRRVSEAEARRLGLDLVEPTLDQAIRAQSGQGPTSFQDRLCLAMARDEGWAVLTNDTALRRACAAEGVSCM